MLLHYALHLRVRFCGATKPGDAWRLPQKGVMQYGIYVLK